MTVTFQVHETSTALVDLSARLTVSEPYIQDCGAAAGGRFLAARAIAFLMRE
jgi:hypothetical protein